MTTAGKAHPPRPRKQSNLLAKLTAFAHGISRDPALYKRTAEEAREIQSAVDAFAQTLRVASEPGTKTRVTVNHKDEKRRIAEEVHSKYYNLIKVDPEISDPDKIAIGVSPVNPERKAISVPPTVPLLNAVGATPHRHTLRFRNGETLKETQGCEKGERGAKPPGAAFIQLYAAIGEERQQPLTEAREVGLFTRNPIVVEYKSDDNGRQAVYWARWISPKGEAGQWSLPTSMAIVA
jgi:hypothetical protein